MTKVSVQYIKFDDPFPEEEFNKVHLWPIKSITDRVVNVKTWYVVRQCNDDESGN